MPTVDQFERLLEAYNTKVGRLIAANRGGPTFKTVQLVSQSIPAAIKSPLVQIEAMAKSKYTQDRKKIPVYFKQLKAQWAAIKLEPVKKYIAQHDVGGAKTRQGKFFTTASAQKAELERVGLCKQLLDHHQKINKLMVALRSAKDFTDLNTEVGETASH